MRYRIDTTDSLNPVMEISVASLIDAGFADLDNPGEAIAEALVDIASEGFDFHFHQYAAEDGVFYVLDERKEYQGDYVSAEFYTTPYKADSQSEYTLTLSSAGNNNGSQTIRYQYDNDGYGDGINVSMIEDTEGAYVKTASGGYELYNDQNTAHQGALRYSIQVNYVDANGDTDIAVTDEKTIMVGNNQVKVKTQGDSGRDTYVTKVIQDIANATSLTLKAEDYTKTDIFGNEKPNIAIDSSFSAYYSKSSYHEPVKMPELIRIQKSGDVPNYLNIPKFALNTGVLGLFNANCLTTANCRNTINMVSYALKKVSSMRSTYGALQNRMEHAIMSNENVSENTTAAESRIRDTDMAKEMVSFSNSQIIAQSALSMLTQANQSSQRVLSLLS